MSSDYLLLFRSLCALLSSCFAMEKGQHWALMFLMSNFEPKNFIALIVALKIFEPPFVPFWVYVLLYKKLKGASMSNFEPQTFHHAYLWTENIWALMSSDYFWLVRSLCAFLSLCFSLEKSPSEPRCFWWALMNYFEPKTFHCASFCNWKYLSQWATIFGKLDPFLPFWAHVLLWERAPVSFYEQFWASNISLC